jgi:hypothetical protein
MGTGNTQVREVFEPGDGVALKDSILRGKKYRTLVPRELVQKIGFPNEFLVLAVARTPQGDPAISIFPCCYTLVRKGDYRCRWHLAELFTRTKLEKLKPGILGEGRPDGRGDRTHSIKTPLDEVVSLEYQDDRDPRLNLTLHGIYGQVLRGLVKLGSSKGIL